MANRYIGSYPVIGIRPIIDGRQGFLDVRGSLEGQTMDMARAVKELIEQNVFYSDGEHAKVIISDTTIGGVAEAALCGQQFEKSGVSITISVSPCWCYGSETMDMSKDTVKAVWGLNATERPGAVYLACVLAAYARKGLPAFGIYGKDVQEADDKRIPEDVREKLLRFARAAVAMKTMRGKSYLQIGSMCMGISGSAVDADFIEEYLGMRVESVDEVEILRRMDREIYSKKEFTKAMKWVRAHCPEGFDKNPAKAGKDSGQKEKDWEFTVKSAMIIRDLMSGNPDLPKGWDEEMKGHNAIAAGFQGQRQWTDYYPNTDFPECILNTSFDWNGKREPYILATENDSLNGLTMLLMKLLTNRAQMFADIRTCWSAQSVKRVTGYELEGKAKEAGGIIHLINSGACCLDASGEAAENGTHMIKPFWEMSEKDMKNCLKATEWCPADLGYFRGGGYSSRFITRYEMPATMARLNIVKGVGPVLQLVEGYTVALPDEVSEVLWKRTDYTWPTTWFTPGITPGSKYTDAYKVMNAWGANHGAISYGHIGADLITLCSMLRIPVCMHNVEEEKIFRPSSWNAFGIDEDTRDYRACAAYGPLYK
jgi:L-fucose isomerase